jgi:hypothetical protein
MQTQCQQSLASGGRQAAGGKKGSITIFKNKTVKLRQYRWEGKRNTAGKGKDKKKLYCRFRFLFLIPNFEKSDLSYFLQITRA